MGRFDKEIWAYSLKNSLEHDGKATTGPVLNALFNFGLEKSDVKKIIKEINDILKKVNSLTFGEQKKSFKKYKKHIGERYTRGGELPELPNSEKGVVMRFSPSPSGPLHVGHVLTIGPSFLYRKRYGGNFFIRIEDTNPENIDYMAYEMIEKEIKWLCKKDYKLIIQSGRLKIYYTYIKRLIEIGFAYVCTCNPESFKELIGKGKACHCRGLGKDENLKRWGRMLDSKGYSVGEAVVRFIGNLQDKNPAFRDFPLARINLTKHPRVGSKYRVWPLMNLAVAVDDIEQKITHIIRGKDHKDNAKRQAMIYHALGLEKKIPWVGFIGRIHFTDLPLSSSFIKEGIKNGKFSGWDDPKLPTVASLKKRKYKPSAFWKYVKEKGISESDKTFKQKDFYDLLDKFNK